jgi:hypothetical protein
MPQGVVDQFADLFDVFDVDGVAEVLMAFEDEDETPNGFGVTGFSFAVQQIETVCHQTLLLAALHS